MDEITASLSNSFQVSKSENNIYAKHPRFDQYKQKSQSDQNTRREKFLSQQKKRRFDFQNNVRCLALNDWKGDQTEENDEMEVSAVKIKQPKRYKDQLMLSEWLVEVPMDFDSEWLMIICPIGRRNLVVAANGKTSCYSKSGYRIDTFQSALPGGSYDSRPGYTVLDCVYNDPEKCFYVIDVMCWNNHPMYDSETEFRFFWRNSKFIETPELATVSKRNEYLFTSLPYHECTKDVILQEISREKPENIDGLLFYHKRTHYTFGSTPLVTWLKPNMLHDILDIELPEGYLKKN